MKKPIHLISRLFVSLKDSPSANAKLPQHLSPYTINVQKLLHFKSKPGKRITDMGADAGYDPANETIIKAGITVSKRRMDIIA